VRPRGLGTITMHARTHPQAPCTKTAKQYCSCGYHSDDKHYKHCKLTKSKASSSLHICCGWHTTDDPAMDVHLILALSMANASTSLVRPQMPHTHHSPSVHVCLVLSLMLSCMCSIHGICSRSSSTSKHPLLGMITSISSSCFQAVHWHQRQCIDGLCQLCPIQPMKQLTEPAILKLPAA